MLRICLWWTLLLLVGSGAAHANDKIRFHVSNFPPYAYKENDQIKGIGVELVAKIMRQAGVEYELELVPNYGRALHSITEAKSDGFFLASQNGERDAIAVLSLPVVINRWCWFIPADSKLDPASAQFKAQARVGTHLHSNTQKWLIDANYTVTGAPSSIESLFEMSKRGRINAIFLSELVFYDAQKRAGQSGAGFTRIVHSERPFGIYISKDYLAKHPDFLAKLNKAIAEVVGRI